MSVSRSERIGQVLGVLVYLFWIAGMVSVTLDMTDWPFRILSAGSVVYIAYRLLQFLRRMRQPEEGL